MTEISSTLTGVFTDVTGISSTPTGVFTDVTGISSTLTRVSNGVTGVSNTLPGVENNVMEILVNLTKVSQNGADKEAFVKIPTSCKEVQQECSECTNGCYKILTADNTEKYIISELYRLDFLAPGREWLTLMH